MEQNNGQQQDQDIKIEEQTETTDGIELETSWETRAGKMRKDPMPMRLASILTLLFGAWNVLSGIMAMVAWMAGGAGVSLGAMALRVMLLPIGLLQVLSGVMLLKVIKDEENIKLRALCRNLGMAMLLVTIAYIVSNFMILGFAFSTLSGPVIAVAYLTVQHSN